MTRTEDISVRWSATDIDAAWTIWWYRWRTDGVPDARRAELVVVLDATARVANGDELGAGLVLASASLSEHTAATAALYLLAIVLASVRPGLADEWRRDTEDLASRYRGVDAEQRRVDRLETLAAAEALAAALDVDTESLAAPFHSQVVALLADSTATMGTHALEVMRVLGGWCRGRPDEFTELCALIAPMEH